jgi:hypothetical protein
MNRTGILRLAGLLAIAAAFWLQSQANASNAAGAYAGLAASSSPLPWVVGGAGVLAIIASFLVPSESKPPVRAVGWHDDPDDPQRLRYWDGAAWGRTAEKS